MNKNTARNRPERMSSGGQEVHMEKARSTWTSVPRDEIYEKRIFDLECYIAQLEHALMMTECERDRYKREACA